MNNKKISLCALILCLLLVPLLNSCNNSLDPINREKGLYSIYGILDISSRTNYIRIKNLNIPLVFDTSRSLNGTVSLINLKTGQSQLLTDDSLVNFDGVVTHNFKSTLPISPVTTYEVVVKRRSDGRKATARVTTPLKTSVSLSPRTVQCGHTRTAIFKKVLPGEYIQSQVKFLIDTTTVTPPRIDIAGYNFPVHYINGGIHSKPKSIKIHFNMKDPMRAVFLDTLDSTPFTRPYPCHFFYKYLVSSKVKFIFIIYRYIHKHITASDSNHIPTSQLVGIYRDSATFIVQPPSKR